MLFVGLSLGADEGKKLPDGDSLGGPDGASESAKLGLLEGFNDNPSVGTLLRDVFVKEVASSAAAGPNLKNYRKRLKCD